jgi:hypothetical protein
MIASKADTVNLSVDKDDPAFIFVTHCANVNMIVAERQAQKVRPDRRIRSIYWSGTNEDFDSM